MLFNIGTGNQGLDALIFILALFGTYIALPIYLVVLGADSGGSEKVAKLKTYALPAGLVWILLHSAFLDPYWHMNGNWIPIIWIPVLATGAWWGYHVMNDPWFEFARQYERLKAQYADANLIEPDELRAATARKAADVIRSDPSFEFLEYSDVPRASALTNTFLDIIEELYRQDRTILPLPETPEFGLWRGKEYYDSILKNLLTAVESTQLDKDRANLVLIEMSGAFKELCLSLHGRTGGPFELPMAEILPDPPENMCAASDWLYDENCKAHHVGDTFRSTFNRNRLLASEKVLSKKDFDAGQYVQPGDYPTATFTELAWTYWKGTKFHNLFTCPLPWGFSERARGEHGVIVAGSGGGKTQLLESLILADLDKDDPPGVILIDSKGEMSDRIAHLDLFHPDHGRLRDRLIIINPTEKPALNMFAMDEELVNSKINEVAALMRYFFGGLFGSELSDQMEVLFLPLLHMILRMPGATLHDFAELVKDPKRYPKVIAKLPRGPKNFILNQYDDRNYAQTKTAIITRLYRIINEVTLDDMFSAPNNAVDIATALNEGKIILVKTDAHGLQDVSPVFGKYFIAQVMNAGLARGSKQGTGRRVIRFYIDECAPYVDTKLETMLTTIRSYGVGLMTAFQNESQMKTFTSAIIGNTAIKIIGSVQFEGDAKAFASSMFTSPEFIMSHKKSGNVGRFACYTTDLARAISIELPFLQLDRRPKMSERDYHRMLMFNRSKLMADPTPTKPEDGFEGTTIDGEAEELPTNQRGLPQPGRTQRKSPKPPTDDSTHAADDF